MRSLANGATRGASLCLVCLFVLVAGIISLPRIAFADDVVHASAAGVVTVEAPEQYADAEILALASSSTSALTQAVVFDGKLTFYADAAGDYLVQRTGYDVWSRMDELPSTSLFSFIRARNGNVLYPSVSNTTHLLESNARFNPYIGVENGEVTRGTAAQPIVALADFVGVGTFASGSLEINNTTADALVGFEHGSELADSAAGGAKGGNAAAIPADDRDYAPMYLLVEDRDENTGKLQASCLFTPEADTLPAASGVGGNQAFNLVVNPDYETARERLLTHANGASNQGFAVTSARQIAEYENLDKCAIIANLDFMAAYSTGEKVYTLDIGSLTDGKIAAGDTVTLKYLGASGDSSVWSSSLSQRYEEKVAATNEELKVDDAGYVTFGLYGGGVYVLGDSQEVAGLAPLAISVATSGQGGDSGGESGSGEQASGDASGTTGAADSESSAAQSSTATGSASASAVSSSSAKSAASSAAAASSAKPTTATSPTYTPTAAQSATAASRQANGASASAQNADEGASVDEGSQGASVTPFQNEDGSISPAGIAFIVLAALLVAGGVLYLAARRKKDAQQQAREAWLAMKAAEEETAKAEAKQPSAEQALERPWETQKNAPKPETFEQKVKRKAQMVAETATQVVDDSAPLSYVLQLKGA